MRLHTKLSLGILPTVAVTIFALGSWSVFNARKALTESARIFMQQTLKTFMDNEMVKRHETLVTHGLNQIPSYVARFQEEASQQAATVQKNVALIYRSAHVFALDTKGMVKACLKHDTVHQDIMDSWKDEIPKITGHPGISPHTAEFNGERFLYVAGYFQPWDWVFFLSISEEELGRPARRIRQATFWLAGAGSGLCLVLIFSFFRWFVTRPIDLLGQIARAMEKRRPFETGLQLSRDELGALARQMQGAAQSLAEYEKKQQAWQTELEQTVKARTRELRHAKQALQTILGAMPFGVTIVDREKRIISVNRPALELMGYENESQVIGRKCQDVFCVNDGPCPIFDKGKKVDKSDRIMMNRLRKKIPIIKSVVPIVLDGKEVLLEAFVDLSRQKEVERALAKSNKELNDFAYIASHDLKEPLRGMANFSEFLMEDYHEELDVAGRAKLETLVKLCKREESLINALLSYSRVGRTDLKIETQDMNELVNDVVQRISHLTQNEDVRLSIAPFLPDVACDRIWTGEVFFNLITNALKYSDKDEKIIEIGAITLKDDPKGLPEGFDGSSPVFFVRDNGIGIREKHIHKIFGIFKRLHGRNKYGGGTGAGLTIVDKIVSRHGGRIRVTSRYGSGTTFYFTLGGIHDAQ